MMEREVSFTSDGREYRGTYTVEKESQLYLRAQEHAGRPPISKS
jgi:hypothetical protein